MTTGRRYPVAVLLVLILAALSAAGCQKTLTPAHPNQINTLDGWAYDSLLVARESLSHASDLVKTDPAFAKFKPQVNVALEAYNAASAAYAAYHTAGSPAADPVPLQTAIGNAVTQVAGLLKTLGVKP